MSERKKICILITATINPANVPDVAVSDFVIREEQYYSSLLFYLGLNVPIVFCENTEADANAIRSVGKQNLEFEYLSFKTSESFKGKGHGEKEILHYAFANSRLLNRAEWVIKISGRYKIENIKKIIEGTNCLDADVVANFGLDLSWADTRIMIFKPKFYFNYFKPYLDRYLDEPNNIYFEKVFAQSIHHLMAERGKYRSWLIYPLYNAGNGTNGKVIKFGFFRRIKFKIYFEIKKFVNKQIV